MGGHGGQLGQSAQLRGGLFLFFVFFVFLFQQLLHFLFAQLTLQNFVIGQDNFKELLCTATKRLGGFWNSCQFYKLKRAFNILLRSLF